MNPMFIPEDLTTLFFDATTCTDLYYSTFNTTYHTPLSTVSTMSQAIELIYIELFNFLTTTRLSIIFILKIKQLKFNNK